VFESVGWGEIIVLALAAMFIFGPDRLPTVARDAARALKRARTAMTDIRSRLDETLDDELAGLRDLDLRRYHPKALLLDEEDRGTG
jgi:sec-independent protein translocase protein TatB